MKMLKTIFLMCGPAGAGKSTWIEKRLKNDGTDICISRDAIRFTLLHDGEDYFAHEAETFEIFCKKIQNAINLEIETIYIDATHLTPKTRSTVLDNINSQGYNIIPVVIQPDLKTILAQNDKREGRAFVPRSVIRRMDIQFQKPTFNEKHHYAEIWFPQPDGKGIMIVPNNGGNR